MKQIHIPARFNGPSGSGNGGYSCGVLAAFIKGPCKVRLHVPPPLDRTLSVHCGDDGKFEMLDGETVVGTAVAESLELDIPVPPSVQRAEQASKGFLCFEQHEYPTCFVCGPHRHQQDGLCLFPGPVDNWDLLACSWQPAPDLLDDLGNVREEIIWSALDCPGFFAAVGESLLPTLLGELTVDIRAPVPGSEPLVVFAWPLGREGRKLYGGVAIANASGDILACSRSVWIALNKT